MTDEPQNATPGPVEDDLPEQMRVRRDKRERLVEEGVAPYPVTVERTHTLAQIRATYDGQELEPDTHTGEQVAVTGRVMFLRNTGKLCFVRLREGDGTELQVMLSLADVGEESLARFKALVDLGDLLAVHGEVITSRRGELSVQATDWSIAAKTLRPLPNEHKPLSDEARIRLRYVDMLVRPEPRAMVRTKAAVLKSLRGTLDEREFVEVETPILQLTNGGAAARPFRTHLNALGQDMLLRIALELDLKRAMIGGVDRVYEIGRTFRNEGLDSTHAAEFSMLEAYEAYGDQHTMMELAKDLVRRCAPGDRQPHRRRAGRQRDRPARRVARGADPRAGLRGGRCCRGRRTPTPRRCAATPTSTTWSSRTAGVRRRSSSSCSSSSSRTRWSSRPSSWTTRSP